MRKAGILIILFVVLILVGRYIFLDIPSISKNSAVESSTLSTPSNNEKSIAPSSASEKKAVPLSCVEEWKQKVKNEKLEYEKGSILVGFVAGVDFDEAVKILGTYGIVIRDMKYAKEYYDSRRIITASVVVGEEYSKLCILKKDASVRYTGLNILFELHD